MKRYLAYAGAPAALGGSGNAVYAADHTDDSLTWFGVTLYGTIDIGYTYENRGAPPSDYFPTCLQYLIQPSNRRSISSVSENGLSQSKIGLRGTHEFGVSSPVYGTLTIGRQNGLLLDNVLKYDPLGGSYAFSVIGYSGAAGGSGDTQDAWLDNSVKYVDQIGMFGVGAQFQSGAGIASGGNATELDLGGDFLPGLSVDAAHANKKDAILGAPLGVAVAKCPTTPAFGGAGSAVNCLPAGISPANAVAATVSNHWGLQR